MTDPTDPPLDPETPTEPRPELRATLTKIFSSRRKNIIAAAVVLILIVGSTAGIIATNNAIDQHNAVIAAAQKSEMEAEAAAELVMETAADLKVQQEDFAAAKIEGQTSIDSVDPFIASVTAWASTAALTELVKLRSDLTETIVTADVTEA